MAPTNRAAWLDAVKTPLVIHDSDYKPPSATQVTIANRALAINPCDWAMQAGLFPLELKWPYILGCDIAGIVHEVGSSVENVKPGDRVLAMVTGLYGDMAAGGFQLYSNAEADLLSKIPDNVSFEEASVLPLATHTAACALFLEDHLGLQYPGAAAPPKDEYVLIWAGSTSVGAIAIQLVKNAGYKVITTCSSHNDRFCLELGAEKAFDHRKDTVVAKVCSFLEGKKFAGTVDAIGSADSAPKCIEVARKADGIKTIANVQPRHAGEKEGGVKVTAILASLKGTETARKIFGEFVPQGLADGRLKAKPDPNVVGQGLESLQAACDTLKAGVSASKIVVRL